MISALIVALGLTLFPGQPHWYELDTRGVEWTVVEDVMTPDSLADYLRSGYQFGGDDGK